MNILITGTASGLGRGFLVHYAEYCFQDRPESTIYALDIQDPLLNLSGAWINSDKSEAIMTWAEQHIVPLPFFDVSSDQHIKQFASKTCDIAWDLIIHSAGIRGLVDGGRNVKRYEDVRKAEDLEAMDADTMRRAFNINALGTFEILRCCITGLKLAAAKSQIDTPESNPGQRPRVIVMGSRMGSIGHNQPANENAGAAYAYRASKAATNAIIRSFSVDVPEAIWTVVHPGRVETGLVRIKEDDAMPVMDSVRVIFELIEKLDQQDNGRFMDRFGKDIPF
jgi:NAD(P)-dependent dehydrogenase (short-subunit alcohol dehydrogenase family)